MSLLLPNISRKAANASPTPKFSYHLPRQARSRFAQVRRIKVF
jgi:hypothetical protein